MEKSEKPEPKTRRAAIKETACLVAGLAEHSIPASRVSLPQPPLEFLGIFQKVTKVKPEAFGEFLRSGQLRVMPEPQDAIEGGKLDARVALGHSSESMTKRYVDIRQIPRTPLSIPRPTCQRKS